ncbi:MAG TPA: hypothetical protein PLV92_26965, partial [Pirellulaceae bacterium]|nr:hypothetical protein [Pirellulaceae bacterium]
WCLQSYPFQPQRLISTFTLGLVGWLVVGIANAMVRFNRNEVLSLLGDTTPGRFTFDRSVWLPLMMYVVMPIASLLTIEFPVLGRFLFGWIGILQRAVGT